MIRHHLTAMSSLAAPLTRVALGCACAALLWGCPAEVGTETDTLADATAETDTGSSDGGSETDGTSETAGLVINEAVCARADSGPDWIEFYVTGTAPVTLSDYAVRDDKTTRVPIALPDVTLQPGEYFVVTADTSAPSDGSAWVDFKLGSGDAVVLFKGATEVQTVDWNDGEAPQGTAFGLLQDGVVGAAGTLDPTPGSSNIPWSGPLPDKLDLFKGDVVYPMSVDLTPSDLADMKANPQTETWYQGSLSMDGQTIADIGVRTKGVTSLRSVHGLETDRFSFRIDANRYVKGQRIDGRRGFVLNNSYLDPTFMREALAFQVYREMGLHTPKTQYVDLTVAGKHMGLYLVVELVDQEFLQDHFADFSDGDLYEPETPASTLQWQGGADPSLYPKMGLETNESTSVGAPFVSLVKSLEEGTFSTRLDTSGALAYVAASAAMGNLDSYLGAGTNYYLYDYNGRFFVTAWDTDQSFGTYNCGCSEAQLLTLPIETPTCGAVSLRPLIDKLLADPTLMTVYEAKLAELTTAGGPFTSAVLDARIETLKTLLQSHIDANPTALFTVADSASNLDTAVTKAVAQVGGETQRMPGLKPFIAARVQSITDQLAGSQPRRGTGDEICAPQP